MNRLLLHPSQHGFYSKTDLRPLLKMACKTPAGEYGNERGSRTLTFLWRFGAQPNQAFSHLVVQRFDYHRLNRFFEVAALAAEEDFGDDTLSTICAPLLRQAGPIFDVIGADGQIKPIQATYSQEGFCFEELSCTLPGGYQMQIAKQTPWMSYEQLINAITGVQYGHTPSPCLELVSESSNGQESSNIDLLVDLDGRVASTLRSVGDPDYFTAQGKVSPVAFCGLGVFQVYAAYRASRGVSN